GGYLSEFGPPVVEYLANVTPGFCILLDLVRNDVTLTRYIRTFPRVGKQAESFGRNPDSMRDLAKSAYITDLPPPRQNLRDVRAVDPQLVSELRLRQAVLLQKRRQHGAHIRTIPRPGRPCRIGKTASPVIAREHGSDQPSS